jgi:hypothetical protein
MVDSKQQTHHFYIFSLPIFKQQEEFIRKQIEPFMNEQECLNQCPKPWFNFNACVERKPMSTQHECEAWFFDLRKCVDECLKMPRSK